jgi:hypothetical protein
MPYFSISARNRLSEMSSVAQVCWCWIVNNCIESLFCQSVHWTTATGQAKRRTRLKECIWWSDGIWMANLAHTLLNSSSSWTSRIDRFPSYVGSSFWKVTLVLNKRLISSWDLPGRVLNKLGLFSPILRSRVSTSCMSKYESISRRLYTYRVRRSWKVDASTDRAVKGGGRCKF